MVFLNNLTYFLRSYPYVIRTLSVRFNQNDLSETFRNLSETSHRPLRDFPETFQTFQTPFSPLRDLSETVDPPVIFRTFQNWQRPLRDFSETFQEPYCFSFCRARCLAVASKGTLGVSQVSLLRLECGRFEDWLLFC